MANEITKHETMTPSAPASGQIRLVEAELSIDQLCARVEKIGAVMQKIMKPNTHYGIVPGAQKPSLWKPGAELLMVTFRLAPRYERTTENDGRHITVFSTCSLYGADGMFLGSGTGMCSSKETKYAFRHGKPHANIEDTHNTVLKMADKRALVAATLIVTGASSMFTQDLQEDNEDGGRDREAPKDMTPRAKAQPAPNQQKAATVVDAKAAPATAPATTSKGIECGLVSVEPQEKNGKSWLNVTLQDADKNTIVAACWSKSLGEKAKTLVGQYVIVETERKEANGREYFNLKAIEAAQESTDQDQPFGATNA